MRVVGENMKRSVLHKALMSRLRFQACLQYYVMTHVSPIQISIPTVALIQISGIHWALWRKGFFKIRKISVATGCSLKGGLILFHLSAH